MVHPVKKPRPFTKNGTQRNLVLLSLWLRGRKRDLVFIAIGELHVGLAWDIRVIPFWKQIDPNIS
jgi:hypothetical protein